jgi:ribosomal protein S14
MGPTNQDSNPFEKIDAYDGVKIVTMVLAGRATKRCPRTGAQSTRMQLSAVAAEGAAAGWPDDVDLANAHRRISSQTAQKRAAERCGRTGGPFLRALALDTTRTPLTQAHEHPDSLEARKIELRLS